MSRISKVCPGDCSKCELLNQGEVEMVTCILDQIFQRVQSQSKVINQLSEQVEQLSRKEEAMPLSLVHVSKESIKEEEDED